MNDFDDIPQNRLNRWLSQWSGLIGGTVVMGFLIGHVVLQTLGYAS
ncbi:hypothetical protein [Aquirhabdus parva]|nr:hypothetical protein [Aquirhabdus parva]